MDNLTIKWVFIRIMSSFYLSEMNPWIKIGSGNEWPVTWRHEAITLANIDSSSKVFCEIHLIAVLQ